ncbi:hypothetical protein HJC23_010789 [Cyclotella cryptica]|uniref:Uncharacterized protein n=1 Tax=Cyclotella cryptica TaxID=29204 RepID=A0ABD3NGE4_9STRA|eukprot:CCRYP_021047-RA/>CCRYP_021047-RA protein AED:0.47 eAED:0.47 QI:0/-1/0/1/-1/1/1/0/209
MTIYIESPPTSLVFSRNDRLSPPPTPGRKRVCLSKDRQDEVPFFFPTNKSIFGPEVNDSNGVEDEGDLLNLLSNAPLPTYFQLRPKSHFGTERHKPRTILSLTELSPVPFSYPGQVTATSRRKCDEPTPRRNMEDLVHLLPPPPLVAPPSRSSPTFVAKRMSTIVSDNASVQAPPRGKSTQKLPSIQRKGMDSRARKIDRRNSMVARCA